MKAKITTIYHCDFCRKYYQHKHAAERHEAICKRNPDNRRACHWCANCTTVRHNFKNIVNIDGMRGVSITTSKDILYCKAKGTYLYPPKTEKAGKPLKIKGFENLPMPHVCSLRKEIEVNF